MKMTLTLNLWKHLFHICSFSQGFQKSEEIILRMILRILSLGFSQIGHESFNKSLCYKRMAQNLKGIRIYQAGTV